MERGRKSVTRSVFSKVDEYGFERPDDFDYESYEDFMSVYIKVLAKRAKKWCELFGESSSMKRNLTMKRYIRKGIPAEYRGRVWMAMSGAEDLRAAMAPDLYTSLITEDLDPAIVETIRLDLPRTYPDNIFFKHPDYHQSALYNVLLAYAHHNSKVGYCQGLNYIAGLLLLVTKDEETTFWLLKVLVEHILEDYYSKTMEGVIVDIEVLSELIRIKAPEVHEHISKLGLPWAVISTKWFICLFAEVLPIETVLRIWDCLFYEGSKIMFRVGITLIKINKQQLLSCEDFTDLADCFKNMTRDVIVTQCHEFLQSLFKVPGSLPNAKIADLRHQISEKRKREKEERDTRKTFAENMVGS